MSIPIVVVIRDPDASNDIHTFNGDVLVHDMDLGYADLHDVGEYLEWAASHLATAQALLDDHGEGTAGEAVDLIRCTVEDVAPDDLVDAAHWANFARGEFRPDWQQILDIASTQKHSVCQHCGRPIVLVDEGWVDPAATGDDSIWRATCGDHDTFAAEHEAPDVEVPT